MAKAKKAKKEAEVKDNSRKIAMCANLAVDRLFVDIDDLTLDGLMSFCADVCLQASIRVKDNYQGENDREKLEAATQHIFGFINAVLNPQPVPTEEAPKEPSE